MGAPWIFRSLQKMRSLVRMRNMLLEFMTISERTSRATDENQDQWKGETERLRSKNNLFEEKDGKRSGYKTCL